MSSSSNEPAERASEDALILENQRVVRVKESGNIFVKKFRNTDLKKLYGRFNPKKVRTIWHKKQRHDDETKPAVESSETVNSHHINIGEENGIGDHRLHGRRNTGWSSQKGKISVLILGVEHVSGQNEDLVVAKDDETKPTVESSETVNSHHINTGDENGIGDRRLQGRRNTGWSFRKVDLEKIFVIFNFVLEIPSALFDQLSSVHKPRYAFLSMLLSFAAIPMCIVELVCKTRKEKFTWKRRGTLPWLYHPSQTHKPFGNFKDIIGFVCALCQCIVTTISFVFVSRHADNPIKVSVWPMLFAFGLLCSKFSEKPERS